MCLEETFLNKSVPKSPWTIAGFFTMAVLTALAIGGCIVVPPASEPNPNTARATSEPTPSKPQAIKEMESKGYRFGYYNNSDVPYWSAESEVEGWSLRIYEDGVFGWSEYVTTESNAASETEIDFFISLGITPDQARLVNLLMLESMQDSQGNAEGCRLGLCCEAHLELDSNLYSWLCEQ